LKLREVEVVIEKRENFLPKGPETSSTWITCTLNRFSHAQMKIDLSSDVINLTTRSVIGCD
jgi:hypothetical protein